MSDQPRAQQTANELRQWEGEYHYPNGLLARGAAVIEELLADLARLRKHLRAVDEEPGDY